MRIFVVEGNCEEHAGVGVTEEQNEEDQHGKVEHGFETAMELQRSVDGLFNEVQVCNFENEKQQAEGIDLVVNGLLVVIDDLLALADTMLISAITSSTKYLMLCRAILLGSVMRMPRW